MAPEPVEVWHGPLMTPSGRPLRRAAVPITAVAPLNPLLKHGDGEVLSRATPDTNLDGIWRVRLFPTSAFQRTDAFYVADETKWGGERWEFTVPDGGGPYRLEDLLLFSPPAGDGPAGPVQRMNDLEDVEAPAGAVGVLTRSADGIFRLVPQEPDWGDPTRWRRDAPSPDGRIPVGAVHVDLASGSVYRYREG